MYKPQIHTQLAFEDFNQPIGLKMNPENRWIKKAERIPWIELEKEYAKNFRNKKGNVAKPLRMALGALLIQKEYSYSDEETVLQIQENPYLQFFIGLPGYQDERPFDATSMVNFRKRLDKTTLIEINEKIVAY
ncbi:transposase, partial [Enterococcus faecium]